MTCRILTLFGEELVPEQIKAVGNSRRFQPPEPDGEETPARPLLEGWEPVKQYYAIGEVATLFGLRSSQIRFWTNEFGLKVRTTRKGDRLYSPDNIRELRAIYHLLRERGFTISGAKTKLKENHNLSVEAVDLRQSLLQLRNQLLRIRNQLA
jgi:DNA-binding transcriptional MerR regulator